VLVELGLVEQRYKAVLEVLDGATVTDVARRNGVVRQTVHDWLRRYAAGGLAGLADGSSKPQSCPHQMAPEVEAAVLALRRAHPGWGPRTIGHRLGRDGVEPVPGWPSIYRCLVRHGLGCGVRQHAIEGCPVEVAAVGHHGTDRGRVGDVRQRIGVEQYQVRQLPGGYGAERIGTVKQLGWVERGRL